MGKGRFKGQLPDELVAFFRNAGKKGGKLSAAARMEKLTPEQRSAIAKKASAAAAEKRSQAAAERKAKERK
jgi:hypothetical protein